MVRPIPQAVLWAALLLSCGPFTPAKAADAPKAPPGSLYERIRALYPEQIPPFLRAGFRKYDERGENVSVGYNRFFLLTTTVSSFTAYFSPLAPGRAGDDVVTAEFARARQEIVRAHPGAKAGEARPATAAKKGRTYKGLRVTFKYQTEFGAPGKQQAVLSDLYVFSRRQPDGEVPNHLPRVRGKDRAGAPGQIPRRLPLARVTNERRGLSVLDLLFSSWRLGALAFIPPLRTYTCTAAFPIMPPSPGAPEGAFAWPNDRRLLRSWKK